MNFLDVLVPLAAFVGHGSLIVMTLNLLNAHNLPRALLTTCNKLAYLFAPGIPLLVAWVVWRNGYSAGDYLLGNLGYWPLVIYAHLCLAACLWALPLWMVRRLQERVPDQLLENHTQVVDMAQALGHRPTHGLVTTILSRVPGNEILHLHVQEKSLHVPYLPAALDGLSIIHLSDLHLTGELTLPFFEELVRQANALDGDLVAITGDIIDKAACLPWLAPTLGKLQSRHGVYFVLGNHEKRIKDRPALRKHLEELGLIDASSRWQEIAVRGEQVVIAGNERPWFGTLPEMQTAPPSLAVGGALRIGLAHTPDQIGWACRNEFDLLLAGHTHGGQVQFPLIGPLLSPSLHGPVFCGGTYYLPPTILHVSRGISGTRQFRFGSPPELAKLVLRKERKASS